MYQMNGLSKLQFMKSVSALSPDLNQERIVAYDGLGQVIKDTHLNPTTRSLSITAYTYDGNSNVTSKGIDGQAATTMTYNKIDQRIDTGFEYDTNGRMIRDDQGCTYGFDDQDHLTSVRVAAGDTNHFEYRADEFLANV
ncbi:hypothetical protein F4809DRAFT_614117 [Biscogniauxia mediterranea]|nr:hypothetical protein F4809DRAFT_614117 [Biscogniauxia mediterranea]